MVKIYDSEDDESKDGEPAIRVTTGSIVMAQGRISYGAGVW